MPRTLLHGSKEASQGASNDSGQCSQGVSLRIWSLGWPAQGGRPPRKSGVKKSRPTFALCRLYAKLSQTMIFGFAVGFENFCFCRFKRRAARALVPRGLPRGRGTVIPKRSRTFTFGGSQTSFLRAYPLALRRQPCDSPPKLPKRISSANPGPALACAMALFPGRGVHFPFPREKGREKGS